MKNLTLKLFTGSVAAALLMAGCGGPEAQTEQAVKSVPKISKSVADVKAAQADAVAALKVTASLTNIAPNSELWSQAAFKNVMLYPQTTVSFNDKKSIELNKNNGAKAAKVAALYNDKEIAIAVIWEDKTESAHLGKTTDLYADAIAMQFAKEVKDVNKLPYIGMGNPDNEVVIYVQKVQFNNYEPNGKGDVAHQVNRHQTALFGKELAEFDKKVASLASDDFERKFVSAGFRSMTEIKDGSAVSQMNISRIEGYGWMATLTRPLKDAYADLSKSAPVALALWDGGKNNRNGTKLLSSWTAVTIGAEDKALNAALNDAVKGDIVKGKELAAANCASCHMLPGNSADAGHAVNDNMGPNLMNIGGYSTAAYLRESIVDPDAVVVPGHNVNAHGGMWYTVTDGKRESAMKYMSAESLGLSETDVNDIVAYLQTLKAKGE